VTHHAPTGELHDALREWARWIYGQAVLAKLAEPKKARAWDGKKTTWLDYSGGIYERTLIEAAMADGIWVEP
jgi:hypothetical protein